MGKVLSGHADALGAVRHPSGAIWEATGYMGLEPREEIWADEEAAGVANLETKLKLWGR